MRYAFILLSLLSASPVAAQQSLGWGEIISPDRLARQVVQAVLLGLRSQIDLTYDRLDIDLRSTSATISGLTLTPVIDDTDYGACQIEIARLRIAGAGFDRPETLSLSGRADGISFPSACAPDEVLATIAATGVDHIVIPRAALSVAYDIPSAGLELDLFSQVDGIAAVRADLNFDYVWFEAVDGSTDPEPVIYFDAGEIVMSNLGGWDAAQEHIPPLFLNPETAGQLVGSIVVGGLINSGMTVQGAHGAGESVAEAWSAFLREPERLALTLAPSEPVYLDMNELETQPGAALELLSPSVSSSMALRAQPVSIELLSNALASPEMLTREQTLQVGRALVTGNGAPPNPDLALSLLMPLIDGGDADALAIAALVEGAVDPVELYAAAVQVPAATPASAGHLDALEARMSFAEIIAAQSDAIASAELQSVTRPEDLRDRALAHLSGLGAPRSYARAAYWARLATAAGDETGKDILADLAYRAVAPKDQNIWEEVDRKAAEHALRDWIAADLPARFARVNSGSGLPTSR